MLSRANGRRAFRRLIDDEVRSALGGGAVEVEPEADVPTAETTTAEIEAEEADAAIDGREPGGATDA